MAAVSSRIGVFGIGLAACWPRFPGLKERLEGYQRQVEGRMAGFGAEVVSAGLDGNDFERLGAEGESLPGPILKIGNTNSRLRFSLPPGQFVNRWREQGPTHHCALGVGHRLAEFRKLSRLMHIPLAAVGGNQ